MRVGLTGGIGAGKSTAARALAALGAVVIDADAVAREVVEPGMPALAEIAERFGSGVICPDGTLDRPALGRVVFGSAQALADLEAITHPAIWSRTAALFAAAPRDALVVHDMPLLVEKGMTGEYHLVLCVGADEATRLGRLVEQRGMTEADARARIRAQADDEQRRAAADVWLPNEAAPADLEALVDELWRTRLVPFRENLAHGIRARAAGSSQSPADPTWPAQAARLMARIGHALAGRVEALEHIGSTAVPGLAAKDVIDLQVGVVALAEADDPAFVEAMAAAGFPRVVGTDHDHGKDGTRWPKRFHGSCDPGRIAHVHVREVGSPGWEWALAFRDRLRADPGERADYERSKADLAARHPDASSYADAKEAWFDAAHVRWALKGEATSGPPTG